MEIIEKGIYNQPGITHRLRPQPTGIALIFVGIICAAVFQLAHPESLWVAGLLEMMVGIGAVSLIMLLCYYTFGDCRRPFYKPSHCILEPEYIFYSADSKDALLAALKKNDSHALETIKKSSIPELLLVSFSNKPETIVYLQLQQQNGKKHKAISEIVNITNK